MGEKIQVLNHEFDKNIVGQIKAHLRAHWGEPHLIETVAKEVGVPKARVGIVLLWTMWTGKTKREAWLGRINRGPVGE